MNEEVKPESGVPATLTPEKDLELADIAGEEPAVVYSKIRTQYPTARKAMLNAPGLVALAGDRGHFPGCRFVCFKAKVGPSGLDADNIEELATALGLQPGAEWPGAEAQINKFFEVFGNLMIVSWYVSFGGDIYAVITTQLENDAMEDMKFAGQELSRLMEKFRAEREEKKAAKAQAARAEEEENKALIELGRKTRDHNLIGKLRELEEQVADLKRRERLAGKSTKEGK